MKIFLATKNIGKIKEMKKMAVGKDIEIISMLDGYDIPEVEETGETFEENSQKKALEISKFLNMIVISDDSGLCVDALDGAPGVYSARFSGEDANDSKNVDKLLEVMKDVENRKAKFVSVVSLARPDGKVYSFRGETEGEIIHERKGTNGFGYDPIFYSHDLEKVFGEVSLEVKKSVSHRGKAFEMLMEKIDDLTK